MFYQEISKRSGGVFYLLQKFGSAASEIFLNHKFQTLDFHNTEKNIIAPSKYEGIELKPSQPEYTNSIDSQ